MVVLTAILGLAATVLFVLGSAQVVSALVQPVSIAAALLTAFFVYTYLDDSDIIQDLTGLELTAMAAEVGLAGLAGFTVYVTLGQLLLGLGLVGSALVLGTVVVLGVTTVREAIREYIEQAI